MLKTLKHKVTISKDGKVYSFNPGDVVEPDAYGIPAKYFEEGYSDKMVRKVPEDT